MIEVEILVEIKEDYIHALEKLKRFAFINEVTLEDEYFYDPLRNNLKPNSQNKTFESFRLRTTSNINQLTYKKDIYRDTIWLYSNENQIEISNSQIARNIILLLGLKPLLVLKSKKRYYRLDNYEIVLEQVENLGIFLEIEYTGNIDESFVEEEKAKIRTLIKNIDIKTSDELNCGKPELYVIRNNIKV